MPTEPVFGGKSGKMAVAQSQPDLHSELQVKQSLKRKTTIKKQNKKQQIQSPKRHKDGKH